MAPPSLPLASALPSLVSFHRVRFFFFSPSDEGLIATLDSPPFSFAPCWACAGCPVSRETCHSWWMLLAHLLPCTLTVLSFLRRCLAPFFPLVCVSSHAMRLDPKFYWWEQYCACTRKIYFSFRGETRLWSASLRRRGSALTDPDPLVEISALHPFFHLLPAWFPYW
jgi:hypothetical protein